MSINHRAWAVLLAVALPVVASAKDEEELPDLEFLEYLGSWQDEDEEWYLEAELEGKPEEKNRRRRKREEDEQD